MKRTFAVLAAILLLAAPVWGEVRAPSSSGSVARVDTPILRLPRIDKAPTIDGTMDDREWRDASALSGFWYDFTIANFRFLAADETQVEVYGAFDNDNLYLAYVSATYPEGSWLRARGRFPDIRQHPHYGLQWDDHVELELRPVPDNREGFERGLFKWFLNPIDTVFDQWWSIDQGDGKQYSSKVRARSSTTDERWVLELAIPLESFRYGGYDEQTEAGEPLVKLPPDGTAWRAWFTRGIGGVTTYFNVFDNHMWNTTKTKLIFDSEAPSFQVRSLGPIMKDVIDLTLEVKNHSERSQTVRLGFFVESAEGLIYSSYDSPELKEGRLELTPGERRVIRLRQAFPGITREGNTLWFDVRQAGRPAKALFRTRLIDFHSMNGGEVDGVSFRERRLEAIAEMRPPKKDFDFRHRFSPYKERVSGIVDIGIHGAARDARRAAEARMMLITADVQERLVAEARASFNGSFATFLMDCPDASPGEQYKLQVLLFDENRRIVGQTTTEPFVYERPEWFGNKIGLNDIVWEPYTPIETTDAGLDLLKHRYTLAPSGLPAQLYIKPETRDLTLEMRQGKAEPDERFLVERGRGPALRAPMRLVGVVAGAKVDARVVAPAKVVRQWKSEIVYESKLRVGPADVTLRTRYDVDGSMHVAMTYGSEGSAVIDKLELVADVRGPVDLVAPVMQGGGMAGTDVWECTLPDKPGVVWDSGEAQPAELFYSRFVPFIYFGSADKGFSYWADSDEHWMLDKTGSAMRLERDAAGRVSWFLTFVNHPSDLEGERTLEFGVQPHPAKPKPDGFREKAWFYRGDQWAWGYQNEPVELTDQYLEGMVHHATGAPRDWDYAKVVEEWDYPMPPRRYGRWRNMGIDDDALGQWFEERGAFWLSKQIRVGRRTGWWWDEYWPTGFSRTEDVSQGYAYFRDPGEIGENELAWQEGFTVTNMRRLFKRLARVFKEEGVPQRQFNWANSQATLLESTSWDCQLVEGAGAAHRSYDIDIVTQFPPSIYRYFTKNFTGLICRLVADGGLLSPGDDPRIERQMIGRVMLHDVGLVPTGPHGQLQQRAQNTHILTKLADFGYFDDEMTEFIPYWRNEGLVDFAGVSGAAPGNDLLVSIFRRPIDDGDGYKCLLVVMNERNAAVEANLSVPAMEKLLGGPNTLTVGGLRGAVEAAEPFADLWSDLVERGADHPALMDLETDRPVMATSKRQPNTFGPIHIPEHDVKLLYAEFNPADAAE